MKAQPHLSVLIVSWDHRDLIERCTASLLNETRGCSMEIIVVDNGSQDGTPDLLRERFPDVRLIRNETNLGYSAAADVAFAHSTGRHVCFLNHDTYLVADALSELARILDSRSDVGAVGPRLRRPTGELHVGAAGFEPGLTSAFCHYFLLSRLSPRLPSLFLHQALHSEPVEVDWLCGACLMIPREVYSRVAPRDARFPLYAEDWVLCRMIRALGKEILYVPQVEVYHHMGHHSGEREEPSVAWILAMDRYLRYVGVGDARRRIIHLLGGAGFSMRWVFGRVRMLGGKEAPAHAAAMRSYFRACWVLATGRHDAAETVLSREGETFAERKHAR